MSEFTIKCVRCGFPQDIRDASKNQHLIEIIQMQAVFAPHSRLVFEYAELFDTTRPIKPAKLCRVLSEIREIWTNGKFAYQRTVYAISRDGIAQGLKLVCGKNFSAPLENHNYLKKVLISIAEEEAKKRADHTEKELARREAMLRAGRREEPVEKHDSPTAKEELSKIKNIIGGRDGQ